MCGCRKNKKIIVQPTEEQVPPTTPAQPAQ